MKRIKKHREKAMAEHRWLAIGYDVHRRTALLVQQ